MKSLPGRRISPTAITAGISRPFPISNLTISSEEDFKTFIEAMSNDVLNWETAKETMRSGGITYADKTILIGAENQPGGRGQRREVHHGRKPGGST